MINSSRTIGATPDPDASPRSPRRRVAPLRRLLIVLIWTVTGVVLLYAIENWRGRRAWQHYEQTMHSRGIELDFRSFLPKEIPDSENFAAIPEVKRWFDVRSDGWPGWKDHFQEANTRMHGSDEPKRRAITDLTAWQTAFEAAKEHRSFDVTNASFNLSQRGRRRDAAAEVISNLQTNEPLWMALRSAGGRKGSRYDIRYNLSSPMETLLPHLTLITANCQRLALHASALLAEGKTEEALDDIQLILRLGESLKEEPNIVSHMVRFRTIQLALQQIWEGLAEHQWSRGQIEQLQTRLLSIRPVDTWQQVVDAERAAVHQQFQVILAGRYRLPSWIGQMDSGAFVTLIQLQPILPKGWIYQELVEFCRLYDLQWGSSFDQNRERLNPRSIDANLESLQAQLSGTNVFANLFGHRAFSKLMLDPGKGFRFHPLLKLASAECALHQSTIACAIERYRLSSGQVPDTLEALKPQFLARLPLDPLSGEPFHYHPKGKENFLLYSVGWNETDDHGAPSRESLFGRDGDWVWSYPERADE